MTDTLEKNALKTSDEWDGKANIVTMTDEEWIEYFCSSESDEKYEMKCIKCGYEEKVPAWIVGEFAGENKALGNTNEVAIECPRCNGAMYRK